MFRELVLPGDDDWSKSGSHWMDDALREWFKSLVTESPEWTRAEEARPDGATQLDRDRLLVLRIIEHMGAARLRLDQELLLLVGQAEELGVTWTAVADALATSPQNAHKVFAKRLMHVRNRVAMGWDVEQALEDFYRRRS
ncbi:hypothetical protein [Micromonospora sp. NPDC005206]|uniref:hypothetical protein n=1 Tax=Micromonospora sp. NPDC005206 TaxID=3157022 RepID=UPI00339DF713